MIQIQEYRRIFRIAVGASLVCFLGGAIAFAQETFSRSENGLVPQAYDQLWGDFDARADPLDIEILEQWEEEGVLLKIVRFRVGVFKGETASMATGKKNGLRTSPKTGRGQRTS